MQQRLATYLRAGYAGLAIVTAEEARAEAEITGACTTLGHRPHAWSSSEGLVYTSDNRISSCPDLLEAIQLIGQLFAVEEPRHVVGMRDLQLHLEETDPRLVRRLKDLLRLAKSGGHALVLLGWSHDARLYYVR